MKEKAGSAMSADDLQAAWEFFDRDNNGTVSVEEVRKRLSVFYKNVTTKEVKFLMSNKSEMTKGELQGMLRETRLVNFDPAREAFKLYDPHGTGFVEKDQLRKFFANMGCADVTDLDLEAIGKYLP